MGKSHSHLVVLLLCAVCVAALAGCGGSDEDADAADPEAKALVPVQKAVSAALANGEYSFDKVKVTRVEVDGFDGTAETELIGGTLGGQTVAVTVAKVAGEWLFISTGKFIDLDKPLLEKKFKKGLSSPKENLTPSQVRCIAKQFAGTDQATVEAMYLDRASEPFVELGKPCKNA
jgi:hypothetical protein